VKCVSEEYLRFSATPSGTKREWYVPLFNLGTFCTKMTKRIYLSANCDSQRMNFGANKNNSRVSLNEDKCPGKLPQVDTASCLRHLRIPHLKQDLFFMLIYNLVERRLTLKIRFLCTTNQYNYSTWQFSCRHL
jgi:hypothetical protein